MVDYCGYWLVMYFYLKDFIFGCIIEVCIFCDDIVKLCKVGVDVIGVSLDDVVLYVKFV